jgi:hypothetical protein
MLPRTQFGRFAEIGNLVASNKSAFHVFNIALNRLPMRMVWPKKS